jgi:hypothetical protein
MNYEIVVPKESIMQIQKIERKHICIIVNQNEKLYHTSVIGPNRELLLQTEDIFNSADIAENVTKQVVEAIIADQLSAEFAETIRYVLK